MAASRRKLRDTAAAPLLLLDQPGAGGLGAWRKDEVIAEPANEGADYIATMSPAEILSSDTCLACGGVKKSGETVDAGCYSILPPAAQAMFPARMHNYLTRPVESASFHDKFKTALAVIAEQREARRAAL